MILPLMWRDSSKTSQTGPFFRPGRWSGARDAKYYRRRDRLVFLEREVAALQRLESCEWCARMHLLALATFPPV